MSFSSVSNRFTRASRPSGRSGSVWPVLLAGVFWLGAALSLSYWGLLWAGRSDWTPVNTSLQSPIEANPVAVAAFLDSTPQETPATETAVVPSRYALLGLVNQAGEQGAALIAIDGKLPRPYKVGDSVSDGWVLQSVSLNGVRLTTSGAEGKDMELRMPSPPQQALLPF